MLTGNMRVQGAMLQALEKAVTADSITALVPEDLEIQAHNTLWEDTQQGELTLLKLLPNTPATSVVHEYTKVTSYGESRMSGFFGERTLPPETSIVTERVTNNIRLMGEIGPTFLLAALEKTQQALGTTGAVNIERAALRLNTLRKKNRNLYFADTRTHRQGDSSVRFKGIMQLIEEGTDGTTGTSPYGSHVVDMEGQPLTVETLRNKSEEVITLFGRIGCLIMDPFARGSFEASFDSAQRLDMPIATRPFIVGGQVAGIQTQGSVIWFETDNTLTPNWAFGRYTTTLPEGGPTTVPTVTGSAAAVAGGRTSKWNAADAGNVFYMVTEMKDELEGLGRRLPATAATYLAVAAADEVTLSITPGNPLADSFRVYRGDDSMTADTDAWFIFEVANSGGGAAVTAYDGNHYRPNTSTAFGLNIQSASQRQLHRATAEGYSANYHSAVDNSANFLQMKDSPRNTVAVASLGPTMGIMALASLLAEVDRPLMYSACCPMVRNPFQNVVFKNVGRN